MSHQDFLEYGLTVLLRYDVAAGDYLSFRRHLIELRAILPNVKNQIIIWHKIKVIIGGINENIKS